MYIHNGILKELRLPEFTLALWERWQASYSLRREKELQKIIRKPEAPP